ncbi:MAG: ABC transporter ATP-binding protein [Pseudomonadota bacterium]|nr:ABC transporter ATP-binding protein [Pseudomonadota bacterium]
MTAPAQKAGNAAPDLVVDSLTVRFGGLVAVDSLSFEVWPGEVLSLIGPNGAGKTTAFNAITGYVQPTGGTVEYRDVRLTGLPPNRIAEQGLVRTFQKTSVFGGQSVFENVLIGLHLRQEQKPWKIIIGLRSVREEEQRMQDEARNILEFVGLSHRALEFGGALPYGEQRLLEVAVALAARPNLLLLDEPVSGMNPSETASFMELLARIRGEGVTLLLVEHDMKVVMGVSDRVIVLNQGVLIARGTPAEVRGNDEVIRAYLGESYRKDKAASGSKIQQGKAAGTGTAAGKKKRSGVRAAKGRDTGRAKR